MTSRRHMDAASFLRGSAGCSRMKIDPAIHEAVARAIDAPHSKLLEIICLVPTGPAQNVFAEVEGGKDAEKKKRLNKLVSAEAAS